MCKSLRGKNSSKRSGNSFLCFRSDSAANFHDQNWKLPLPPLVTYHIILQLNWGKQWEVCTAVHLKVLKIYLIHNTIFHWKHTCSICYIQGNEYYQYLYLKDALKSLCSCFIFYFFVLRVIGSKVSTQHFWSLKDSMKGGNQFACLTLYNPFFSQKIICVYVLLGSISYVSQYMFLLLGCFFFPK